MSIECTPFTNLSGTVLVLLQPFFFVEDRQIQCPFAKGHQNSAPKGTVLRTIKWCPKGPKGTISVLFIFLSVPLLLPLHLVCMCEFGLKDFSLGLSKQVVHLSEGFFFFEKLRASEAKKCAVEKMCAFCARECKRYERGDSKCTIYFGWPQAGTRPFLRQHKEYLKFLQCTPNHRAGLA